MKKSIAIVGLLACSPLWAAEGLSYNYVQLNWVADSELESGGSVDGDGFNLGGVFSFNESFYVLGDYTDLEYDNDAETQEISLGVGAHSNAYTGAIDIFGNLTYEDIEIEVGGLSGDDDGFGLEVGARMALMPGLDAYISYDYDSYSDADGNFFKIGGAWAFNPNWSIAAEYTTGDYDFDDISAELDRDDLRVGVRYNF